jgi:predicted RNase H-like nuclease (RuvC/YqgF family)
MTPEISDIIKQIKFRFIELNDKYRSELVKSNLQKTEIETLNATLNEHETQNKALLDLISNLKNEISNLNEESNKSRINQDNDLEIDLLVREIDHCIQQLKRN